MGQRYQKMCSRYSNYERGRKKNIMIIMIYIHIYISTIKTKKLTPQTTPSTQPTASVIQHRHSTVESSLQSEASLKISSPLLRAPESSIAGYPREWGATALFGLGAADGPSP